MNLRDIVVIGASAGGVRALQTVVRHLPANLEAAVFIVMHTASNHKSILPEILSKAGPLPAFAARNGDTIEHGKIYLAPMDRHMLLERGSVRIVFGPKENLFRPAIDPLFRSAASAYGNRVIGVLLSGGLDDGCNGLQEIRNQGGIAIVQEPSEATIPYLILNAIRRVDVNHVLPAAKIAKFLASEVTQPVVKQETSSMVDDRAHRHFDGITCPDCNGPIFEQDSQVLRFGCIAGHSYSPEVMRIEHAKKLENALWSAIATFEEHATVLRRLAQHGIANGLENFQDLEIEAQMKLKQASELRAFVEKINGD